MLWRTLSLPIPNKKYHEDILAIAGVGTLLMGLRVGRQAPAIKLAKVGKGILRRSGVATSS
jgi:hypothetical protein